MARTHSPLKTAIFQSGKPQIAIGKLAGIHEARISKIANGHEPPREWEKKALAKVLKRPIAELFPEPVEATP